MDGSRAISGGEFGGFNYQQEYGLVLGSAAVQVPTIIMGKVYSFKTQKKKKKEYRNGQPHSGPSFRKIIR